MSRNLPLLPEKTETCGDVRPLLREVFREVDAQAQLTDHLKCEQKQKDAFDVIPNNWSSEFEELKNYEEKLQHEYAKKLAREPQTRGYELCASDVLPNDGGWKEQYGIIQRKDLMPGILENPDQQCCRWIMKTVSESTYTFNTMEEHSDELEAPAQDLALSPKDLTVQSVSCGEPSQRSPGAPAPRPRPAPPPRCLECEPAQLSFINFTLGYDHVLPVRLLNVSRHEVRLSLQPPTRLELQVELVGGRGMKMTSGSALELRVHFKPKDVRSFQDKLVIRATRGATLTVPITCFMEPPLLDVTVPSSNHELFSSWDAMMPARNDLLDLGARLLGEVHRVELQLRCSVDHASFFIMSEDAWNSFVVDEKALKMCNVVVGAFSAWPARWRGGVRGAAACRAPTAGLRSAVLRVLSSTAVVRSLTIVADAVMFSTQHITLQTQEKDYDILCEGDPSCPYYVHLGTAFPNQPLAATIHLINHSAVGYSYYWSVRAWDKNLTPDMQSDSEFLDEETPESDSLSLNAEAVDVIRVEPSRGAAPARSARAVHACAPRAGAARGTRRLVLMLILTDVPYECISREYEHMITGTKTIEEAAVPGLCEAWTRTVCEVLYTQMEVWWEVVPVHFVLNPNIVQLTYTRRVNSIEVPMEVTQLHGSSCVQAAWAGGALSVLPLLPRRSVATTLRVPLCCVGDQHTNNIFQLEATGGEWSAWCVVSLCCTSLQGTLLPRARWLGTVPPGAEVSAQLLLHNNTFDTINWKMRVYQVWEAGRVGCEPRGGVCPGCSNRACACAALSPYSGVLPHGHLEPVTYRCRAPTREGCVMNLVQLQHWAPYLPRDERAVRCALIAYRVLEPRCVLRVVSCGSDGWCHCGNCKVDAGDAAGAGAGGGAGGGGGAAVLRPGGALAVGEHACYRLRCTNLTPVPTALSWHTPKQYDVSLKISFIPAEYEVGPYGTVTTEVALRARAACSRRVWACCAQLRHARAPLYLLVDAAVEGRKVSIEVPVDDCIDPVATITSSEPGVSPCDSKEINSLTPEEIFTEYDAKRIKKEEPELSIAESDLCPCFEPSITVADAALEGVEEYAPDTASDAPSDPASDAPSDPAPSDAPSTAPDMADKSSDIEPDNTLKNESENTLTKEPDIVPDIVPDTIPGTASDTVQTVKTEPICLQFRNVTVGTAQSRSITVRNAGALPVRWRARVRRWPQAGPPALRSGSCLLNRVHTRRTAHCALDGRCVRGARAPGVWLQCAPARGGLPAGRGARLRLTVYADCWGLYTDQLLIQVERLEPIILDVWIEVIGVPLQFAIKPNGKSDELPVLWMSSSDPERNLHVTNTSRSDLSVQTYVFKDNENPKDSVPLRLYLRFFDVVKQEISLREREGYTIAFRDGELPSPQEKDEPGTGIELYLSDDYGLQEETVFEVEPREFVIPAGGKAALSVRLRSETPLSASAMLVIRSQPLQRQGPCWYRPDPAPQRAHLRCEERARLQLSCNSLRVLLSALHLPPDDVTRVRKYFRALNVGDGLLAVDALTESPWTVYLPNNPNTGCVPACNKKSERLVLELPPHSNVEICAEYTVYTSDVWPSGDAEYNAKECFVTEMNFYESSQSLLARMSLVVKLEVPVLRIEPVQYDFGFVATGNRRKTYFTISHTSTLHPVEVLVSYEGGSDFKVSPSSLNLPPKCSGRVYVQYTSRRSSAEAAGAVRVRAAGAAGRWCRARAALRAAHAADRARALPPHDHTDDTALPPC